MFSFLASQKYYDPFTISTCLVSCFICFSFLQLILAILYEAVTRLAFSQKVIKMLATHKYFEPLQNMPWICQFPDHCHGTNSSVWNSLMLHCSYCTDYCDTGILLWITNIYHFFFLLTPIHFKDSTLFY